MKLYCRKIKLTSRIWICLCILFTGTLFPFPSFSQFSEIQAEPLKGKYLNEELYVGTDRSIYISGEAVYLKVFCFNRLTHRPLSFSKVVYVTLLDHTASPVVQLKVGLNGSSGSGKLWLPDTLKTGNYFISSCTQWMRNYSSDLFSYKKISVINPFQNVGQLRIPPSETVTDTILFYPESGKIVQGAETKVGIRCLDKNKDPLGVNGFIMHGNKDTLCRVSTDVTGYGLFSILPKDTTKLYLVVKDDNLSQKRFPLPAVSGDGIAFRVEKTGEQDKTGLQIQKSPGFAASGQRYHLFYAPFAMSPFIKEFDPGKVTEMLLQTNTLPPGLSTIMITDAHGRILAGRLFYNKPPEPHISVTPGKTSFLTREKVTVEISTENQAGDPAESDLMVSVVRSFAANNAGQNNLCRFIQLPGPAADNSNSQYPDVNDQLIFYSGKDNFLTGFSDTDSEPLYLPEPDGHLISGTAYNSITGEPLSAENLVLSVVDKTALCRFTKTDGNGVFNFIITESGKHEVVIQPLRTELNNYYIELNNPFPETFNSCVPSPFFIDTFRLAEINKAVISKQVQTIYGPFRPNEIDHREQNIKPAFYGKPEQEVQLADYIQLVSLKEAIKELIPVAFTDTRNGKNYINLINSSPDKSFLTNPFVMIDGVPFYDHDAVLKIAPAEIAKIEVLNTRYYVSDVCLEGIIDLKTTKGNLNLSAVEMPVFRQEFEAPSYGSGFWSPEYRTVEQKKSRIPDFRNTLYWNPDIRTDKRGKATLEFFTSDEEGNFTILIEGFNGEGAKGSGVATFTVHSK
jgi:hypothetical protein